MGIGFSFPPDQNPSILGDIYMIRTIAFSLVSVLLASSAFAANVRCSSPALGTLIISQSEYGCSMFLAQNSGKIFETTVASNRTLQCTEIYDGAQYTMSSQVRMNEDVNVTGIVSLKRTTSANVTVVKVAIAGLNAGTFTDVSCTQY